MAEEKVAAPENTKEGAVATEVKTEGESLLGAAAGGDKVEAPAGDPKDPKAAAPEAKPEDKKEDAKPGAPEKYDFKLPEGVVLDPAMVEEFTSIAKGLNLPQEAAQKLVDLDLKRQAESAKAQQAAVTKAIEDLKTETVKSLGAEWKTQMGTAAKAIERFGSPELKDLLNQTGLGNHKALVEFCIKVGKAISEDKLVEGKSGVEPSKSHAERLYGAKPK